MVDGKWRAQGARLSICAIPVLREFRFLYCPELRLGDAFNRWSRSTFNVLFLSAQRGALFCCWVVCAVFPINNAPVIPTAGVLFGHCPSGSISEWRDLPATSTWWCRAVNDGRRCRIGVRHDVNFYFIGFNKKLLSAVASLRFKQFHNRCNFRMNTPACRSSTMLHVYLTKPWRSLASLSIPRHRLAPQSPSCAVLGSVRVLNFFQYQRRLTEVPPCSVLLRNGEGFRVGQTAVDIRRRHRIFALLRAG